MKFFCALLFIFVGLPVLAAAPKQAHDGYIVQDPVLIHLEDGATLSAIVVRKKGVTEPRPATLFFTPYSQGPGDVQFAKIPAERGYVGVVVYSRGIRADIKDFVPYVHDGEDAREAIEWIARQPWCDGKVGMFGGSYVGFVQWAVARNPPAALKTIVPQVAVMPGIDSPMENNVFQSFMLRWANDILGFPPLTANLYGKWYRRGLPYRELDRLDGHSNRIFQQWLRHPAYDNYWQSLVPTPEQLAALKIPILVTDGYYDGSQIGSMQYVREYFKYNKHPDLYLVIGPWDHFGAQRSAAPVLMGYRIDPVADISMRKLAFKWLDWVLKGASKPKILKNRINYEVMGMNEWKHAPSFRAMRDQTLTLYLSDKRNGSSYLLDFLAPAHPDHMDQSVDFRDRPTQNNYYTSSITSNHLESSSVHSLIFVSRPFNHSFSINGSFTGKLIASINKKDMDFYVAIYELMPDGKYFYLAHDICRASYAHDRRHRELLIPGEKTEIPLAATNIVSRRISKGSRLVVVLNVDKNPYMEINYGTGKPVATESIKDAGQPLRIEWYGDSRITVPVMSDLPPHVLDGDQ